MKVLVTGTAGFIGFHVALRLLEHKNDVIGVDNLNHHYDPKLKQARLSRLTASPRFTDVRVDIANRAEMAAVFAKYRPERVVHLAAQAGVRYSLANPGAYIDSNLVGFGNILEGCRQNNVRHLVYASSSSVYGANTTLPFSVHQHVEHPLSLYAATKKANELMAHTYSHLFGLPTTGLRFFTVYGPWGRPDMALFLFTRNILAGEPIDVYNYGHHRRAFTYIDDAVEALLRILHKVPEPHPAWSSAGPDPATSAAPYRLYNIGSREPVDLLRYIEVIEEHLGRKAKLNLLPLQPGDVPETCAEVEDLISDIGSWTQTPIEIGVKNFVSWYRSRYEPELV